MYKTSIPFSISNFESQELTHLMIFDTFPTALVSEEVTGSKFHPPHNIEPHLAFHALVSLS